MMEKINLNKTNLRKIIQWSSSRYNEYKKIEVVDEILDKIDKGKDFKKRYGTGSYVKGGHESGWGYILEIKDGRNYLTLDPSGKKYELVTNQQKPKGMTNICKKCGAENTLWPRWEGKKRYYYCENCNKPSTGITKIQWRKKQQQKPKQIKPKKIYKPKNLPLKASVAQEMIERYGYYKYQKTKDGIVWFPSVKKLELHYKNIYEKRVRQSEYAIYEKPLGNYYYREINKDRIARLL